MRYKTFNWLLAIICSTIVTSCEKDHTLPDTPVQGTKNGLVTGMITDANNLPVKDAFITIEHTVWYNSYLLTTSNTEGKYEVSLPNEPAGDWTAKAQFRKTAYGQTYKFDLDPDNIGAFSKATGAVRNFRWKLSGLRPGGTGYYGAHVDLYPFGVNIDMTKIKLQFNPYPGESNLIDGTVATAFERQVENIAGTFMAKDIPIGKYTVKALYPGKTLLLNNRHLNDNNEETKTVIFCKNGYLGETEYNIEFYVTE